MPSNVPYNWIKYSTINSMGKQWIFEYTVATCKELLGLVRSKFSTVPIPGGDLQLNGSDLIGNGREDKEKLKTSLAEWLESLTYEKMIEGEANKADNLQKVLRTIPMPMGKCIVIG